MKNTSHTWFVYVLYNQDRQKTYVGITSDLFRRLQHHNNLLPHKKTSFTYKNSGDWKLIYREQFSIYEEAIKKEKWFKSGVGRDFIKSKLKVWIKEAQLVDPPQADY